MLERWRKGASTNHGWPFKAEKDNEIGHPVELQKQHAAGVPIASTVG